MINSVKEQVRICKILVREIIDKQTILETKIELVRDKLRYLMDKLKKLEKKVPLETEVKK